MPDKPIITDKTIIINLTDEQLAELESLAVREGEEINSFMATALLHGLDSFRQRRIALDAMESGEWNEGPYISAASVLRRREQPRGDSDS